MMQRITITMDDELATYLDDYIAQKSYASRSEAVRDLVRDALVNHHEQPDEPRCFGILSYLYEHNTRELARRLTESQHHHHDLSVSTLHMHVNETDCLEVSILKGLRHELEQFADSVTSQRGVNHGHLQLIPAPASDINDDKNNNQHNNK
ncbi:nickel-responsive transcriptional regulator NikR [Vibrio tritonius]|uniref:nickel-responsive transcriptional regulator NikR n=1 Tax=Vibrio tritonius TaxID=1435069 RepID=UPI000ACDFE4D|nr:nickel-responsive transcriptional regulator NikR [Vibrio tritonius]